MRGEDHNGANAVCAYCGVRQSPGQYRTPAPPMLSEDGTGRIFLTVAYLRYGKVGVNLKAYAKAYIVNLNIYICSVMG